MALTAKAFVKYGDSNGVSRPSGVCLESSVAFFTEDLEWGFYMTQKTLTPSTTV